MAGDWKWQRIKCERISTLKAYLVTIFVPFAIKQQFTMIRLSRGRFRAEHKRRFSSRAFPAFDVNAIDNSVNCFDVIDSSVCRHFSVSMKTRQHVMERSICRGAPSVALFSRVHVIFAIIECSQVQRFAGTELFRALALAEHRLPSQPVGMMSTERQRREFKSRGDSRIDSLIIPMITTLFLRIHYEFGSVCTTMAAPAHFYFRSGVSAHGA